MTIQKMPAFTIYPSQKNPVGVQRFGASPVSTQPPEVPDASRYTDYTPDNSPSPPATYHTLYSPTAMLTHKERADALREYNPKYQSTIPWINSPRSIDSVPWTVFDTETTGLDNNVKTHLRSKSFDRLRQRIIQLAAVVTKAKADDASGSPVWPHLIDRQKDVDWYINPGLEDDIYKHPLQAEGHKSEGKQFPINPKASAIHGIKDGDLADKKTLFQPMGGPNTAKRLKYFRLDMLGKNGLGVAYNAGFDIAYINKYITAWNEKKELRRSTDRMPHLDDTIVLDPFILIQRIHPFATLEKSLETHYNLLMGKKLDNAHNALADVRATVDVMKYISQYLQKHTIPRPWAEFAAALVPVEIKDMQDKRYQEAFIARVVRENRELFQQAIPLDKGDVLAVRDVLFFQHGEMPTYEPGLPKLDIPLNIFGWDGSKDWYQLSYRNPATWDTFDPEVVAQIRKERAAEDRMYYQGQLRKSMAAWTSPTLEEMLGEIKTLTAKDDKYIEGVRKKLQSTLVDVALNSTDETAYGQGFNDALRQFIQERRGINQSQADALVEKYGDILRQGLWEHKQQILEFLKKDLPYEAIPVEPGKPLLDPSVTAMLEKMEDLRNKGDQKSTGLRFGSAYHNIERLYPNKAEQKLAVMA